MEYPIVEIPMEFLYYAWEEPPLGLKNPNYNPFTDFLKNYYKIEENLKAGWKVMDPVSKWDKVQFNIQEVMINIEEQGLVNPLILRQLTADFYLVLVGNQRLCSLRGLHNTEPVKCRVVENYDTRECFAKHPYEQVQCI